MSAASLDAFGTDRDPGSEAYRAEDFPGCEPFHLPASDLDHYEGHLEFWDGVTETAWKVCEPTFNSARGAVPPAGADGHTVRNCARLADRMLRLRGSGAPGRGGAQALADAGRRGAVPAHGPGAAAGAGHRRGRRPAAGCGAGGGPYDGRAPAEAGDLQGERVPRDLGAGAVGVVGACAGARHSRAPGGRISGRKERAGPFRGGRRRRFTLRSSRLRCRRRHGVRWNGRRWRWVRGRAPGRRTTR